MKRKIVLFSSILLAGLYILGISSCKKEEDKDFLLSTLMADNVDLNGAAAPSNVAPEPTIVATFSSDVDAATANATSITLTRDYDGAVITLTITVTGSTITIVPGEGLGNGSLYELKFLAGIKGTNGKDLTPFNRAFTTEGSFVPSGMVAYWNFENNADDQVGAWDPAPADVIDVVYVDSYTAAAGKAASFNGSTTLIEIPDGDQLMNTHDFTLNFWVRTNSTDKTNGHFVMGLAGWYGFQFEIFGDYKGCKLAAQYDLGNGGSASEDLWFAGDGNLGWQGWTYCKDLSGSGGLEFLIQDKWANIVCVYDSQTKVGTMYINGERMKAQDFNLWPEGDPKKGVVGLKYAGEPLGNQLAFGFIQARENKAIADAWADYSDPNNPHFKGWLDDVRVFHKALTPTEIQLMYDSAKP
jgi:hypothetical protein